MTRPPTSLPRQLPPRGPVSHPSLKDSAADYLREQILTGQLTPGTKIDQDEISDALGISRLPVREALIELANEGLVDAVPRRGAFVARLERADIVDHYRIFGLVAGLAASRAATSLTDAQLVELRQVHESFLAATDADAQATWNHEFHRRINRAGGSRRLVSVLALLSRSLPVRYFEFVPGWAEASASSPRADPRCARAARRARGATGHGAPRDRERGARGRDPAGDGVLGRRHRVRPATRGHRAPHADRNQRGSC